MEQPGRTARVKRGSHTVPWVEESNPGLGPQPSRKQHLFLPKRSPELPGWNVSFLASDHWLLGFPGVSKSWSSKGGFSPGISLPVNKRPTLVAEMSFLPNLHPGGWECGQPLGRAPGVHVSRDRERAHPSEAQNSQSSTSSSSRFVTRLKIPLGS